MVEGSELLQELVSALRRERQPRDVPGTGHAQPWQEGPRAQHTSWCLIRLGELCLIPLCGHQNGNGFIGLFVPYFENDRCPWGKFRHCGSVNTETNVDCNCF